MILENGKQICRLPCIVCGRALESAACGDYYNQPYLGTAFTSQGHYGSTVHDPMNGDWLEINLCDHCIVENRDKIYYCERMTAAVKFFDEVFTQNDVHNWTAFVSK